MTGDREAGGQKSGGGAVTGRRAVTGGDVVVEDFLRSQKIKNVLINLNRVLNQLEETRMINFNSLMFPFPITFLQHFDGL